MEVSIIQHNLFSNFRWFSFFISSLIIVNTINLSIYDYSDRQDTSFRNQILGKLDVVLTSVFIFEAAIKIIAMGFIIHKYSYMRYGWNVVDFIIVVIG